MKRAIVGVIVGYLTWTALWLGGNSIFFGTAAKVVGAGEPYTAGGPLVGLIVLSVVCSLAAGITTATIGKERVRGAVLVMAALLFFTGLAVQIGIWALMPRWYHVTFLALIVPMVILGAKLSRRAA